MKRIKHPALSALITQAFQISGCLLRTFASNTKRRLAVFG
jgi:hypothetical protein